MTFYFGEKQGDTLVSKINLRDISSRARQWDHPVKGLLKHIELLRKHEKNILKLSKKDRESYCISIIGMALREDTNTDWWINIPKNDPPDGLVMTLHEDHPGSFRAHLREIEVVEHRTSPEQIFNTIHKKMTLKMYDSNTILVCLVLTPSLYNFQSLANKLKGISSSVGHVFVVFIGTSLTNSKDSPKDLFPMFTLVQLLPVFESISTDTASHLNDFFIKYKKGQESRIIENNGVFFGTTNKAAITSDI